MSRAKEGSKRKRRACAVPLLGAAGLSLSLASGAPADAGLSFFGLGAGEPWADHLGCMRQAA
jgi:hypothetical protein